MYSFRIIYVRKINIPKVIFLENRFLCRVFFLKRACFIMLLKLDPREKVFGREIFVSKVAFYWEDICIPHRRPTAGDRDALDHPPGGHAGLPGPGPPPGFRAVCPFESPPVPCFGRQDFLCGGGLLNERWTHTRVFCVMKYRYINICI